jgi:hypothetical protein
VQMPPCEKFPDPSYKLKGPTSPRIITGGYTIITYVDVDHCLCISLFNIVFQTCLMVFSQRFLDPICLFAPILGVSPARGHSPLLESLYPPFPSPFSPLSRVPLYRPTTPESPDRSVSPSSGLPLNVHVTEESTCLVYT